MVKTFELDDINEVNDLLKEFDYKVDENSFEINKFLRVLVYFDGKIRGVLVYRYYFDALEIDYIVVDDKFRRKGIGSMLLNKMIENHPNALSITLEVREGNGPAINFYKNIGFKEVAKRKHYYKNEDGLLMLKELR